MTRQGPGDYPDARARRAAIPDEVRVAELPFQITRPLGISWLRDTLLTPATYAFLDTFKHLDIAHQNGSSQYVCSERAYSSAQGEATPSNEKTPIPAARNH